ncbi:MAG: FAD-dependent oxidoreductase [Bdellovibrionales bacterium]
MAAKRGPTLKVMIIDKSTLAGGASGRNAGFVTCGSVEHFHRLCEFKGNDEALKMGNIGKKPQPAQKKKFYPIVKKTSGMNNSAVFHWLQLTKNLMV